MKKETQKSNQMTAQIVLLFKGLSARVLKLEEKAKQTESALNVAQNMLRDDMDKFEQLGTKVGRLDRHNTILAAVLDKNDDEELGLAQMVNSNTALNNSLAKTIEQNKMEFTKFGSHKIYAEQEVIKNIVNQIKRSNEQLKHQVDYLNISMEKINQKQSQQKMFIEGMFIKENQKTSRALQLVDKKIEDDRNTV